MVRNSAVCPNLVLSGEQTLLNKEICSGSLGAPQRKSPILNSWLSKHTEATEERREREVSRSAHIKYMRCLLEGGAKRREFIDRQFSGAKVGYKYTHTHIALLHICDDCCTLCIPPLGTGGCSTPKRHGAASHKGIES
jgi:hypothetical protein